MTSPLSKLQMKRRILWLAVLLLPIHLLVGFHPIATPGAIILTTIASIIIEHSVVNHFIYKAASDYQREEIFSNGFNGTATIMMSSVLLILVSAMKSNWTLYLFAFFGYFFAASTWVAYWCSKNFYQTYVKVPQVKNEDT